MLSRLQGKQNLWWLTEGHCTKCVSSNRSWHSVHFNVAVCTVGTDAADVGTVPSELCGVVVALFAPTPGGWLDCASVLVTVVLETCLEPDDRRPLDDPVGRGEIKIKLNQNIRMNEN